MVGDVATRDRLIAAARGWRDDDPDPATRAEVDALIAAEALDQLADRFGSRLQFGTAGLRGAVGAGPNRMNRAMVRRTTAGLAAWLSANGSDGGTVVVGRDARHGSAEFAADTAAVLSAAGFAVRVLSKVLPTPVLAFAVRHVGAVAGVMITASHNPPADNGYKLYLGDGAQIVPPIDEEISAAIDAVGPVQQIPLSDDGIDVVGDDLLDSYLDAAVGLLDPGSSRDVRIVHTAMHGVGTETVLAALERAGFPAPALVAQQAQPDPDFPTVAFPNPEEPGALDLALDQAAAVGADVVLANDPDADRLAVAVPDRTAGSWRALTGDEVGSLLADHLLRRGGWTANDTLVTTVVSSRMLEAQAAEAGVAYAEALTGFKWVVRAPAPGARFLFGYEEALGYSVDDVVRDKDGITAALVAAELVAMLRSDGLTLLDRLDELAHRFGAHVTRQRSIRIEGPDWLQRVTAAMAALRSSPPGAIAGRAVKTVEDLLEGRRLPPADVLTFGLDGARLVVRPSGTEPKLKLYAEAVVPVDADSDPAVARAAADATLDEVLSAAVALLGF
jgi:phosphomannomutase